MVVIIFQLRHVVSADITFVRVWMLNVTEFTSFTSVTYSYVHTQSFTVHGRYIHKHSHIIAVFSHNKHKK